MESPKIVTNWYTEQMEYLDSSSPDDRVATSMKAQLAYNALCRARMDEQVKHSDERKKLYGRLLNQKKIRISTLVKLYHRLRRRDS